ncbi:RecB family exonuclease [Thauera propionica]|uniref:RecB family exonuclease n=1 Tax=Thauera propionica TaxID=2019431 RepID=UPI0023F0A35F|nr:PD-(D/E)XK nuclease family protein [Thauera propionica]MDD3676040.1 PD-(D/E)XK nuclease family protein [Thauera propionica]
MTPVIIRASSLGRLFDCPASWAATYIEGKRVPSNGKAMLGKAVHASTAVYDQSRIDGAGITIDEAAAAAVDIIHYHPDEDVVWDDDTPQDVEKIALSLHTKYCQIIAPQQNYTAVEIQCERLEISDIGLILTGTTDRVRETEEGFSICDLKTGKAAVGPDGKVKTAGHAYQMGVYELLAEHASGVPISAPAQIIGMNTAKTPASQRVGTGEIAGARDVLLGDGESPGVLEYAAKIIHSGMFWGNPKSMMCHERYCPIFSTCKFRK